MHPKQNTGTAGETRCATYTYASFDIWLDLKHSSIASNYVAKNEFARGNPLSSQGKTNPTILFVS